MAVVAGSRDIELSEVDPLKDHDKFLDEMSKKVDLMMVASRSDSSSDVGTSYSTKTHEDSCKSCCGPPSCEHKECPKPCPELCPKPCPKPCPCNCKPCEPCKPCDPCPKCPPCPECPACPKCEPCKTCEKPFKCEEPCRQCKEPCKEPCEKSSPTCCPTCSKEDEIQQTFFIAAQQI